MKKRDSFIVADRVGDMREYAAHRDEVAHARDRFQTRCPQVS